MTRRAPVAIFPRRVVDHYDTVLRFTRQLRARSDDADAWHALGAAFMSLGDRRAALTAFRNAVRLDQSRSQTQLLLGNLLFDCGQFDQALHCFEQAGLQHQSSPG